MVAARKGVPEGLGQRPFRCASDLQLSLQRAMCLRFRISSHESVSNSAPGLEHLRRRAALQPQTSSGLWGHGHPHSAAAHGRLWQRGDGGPGGCESGGQAALETRVECCSQSVIWVACQGMEEQGSTPLFGEVSPELPSVFQAPEV